ncbi:MAG: SDR family NAD(P)-dependent oxidoreductase [Gammaproteobacteria bacterium]|nr:SDR family NAD(P)-dependent oxidoreductase [Gammaproteobacteria bacterium]
MDRSYSADAPVAIIGIGCRFPGKVDSPSSFWDLLARGGDTIIDVPPDRWNSARFYDPDPKKSGKLYFRAGGFLQHRIDQLDAAFFGISPREAEDLDPQQRLLLEVAWEAIEDAGLVPAHLAGSETGVYIGAFALDYLLTQLNPLNRHAIDQHTAVGITATILSNRLSYLFDLRGPSMTMDTACSSSLVALHHAFRAVASGECVLALAGGVNVMLRPEFPIAMCKGGFLSPDGRCKSFDARADGYGRGEGAGIVVLKRLSDALNDNDAIYALVRATGVNQDGRTDGITVPNRVAQETLIRRVCAQAKLSPRAIRYVEAHGTGTAVGDPIEAAALGAVIGKDRAPHEACPVGSVKANIGHLEAAAGIAGVIKSALCLQHRQIPPLANFNAPNPAIPFEQLGLRLPLQTEPMPDGEGPACIAINSFGYGGTNAHAVLQEAPAVSAVRAAEETRETFYLLPLSARDKPALTDLARAYHARLQQPDAPRLRDLCYSAALRRGHHERRVALVAESAEAMCQQLQSFVAGTPAEGIASGTSSFTGQKPVFVFTGMGPQWWAMGRELLQHAPEFRRVAEACDELFQRLAGWSILAELTVDENRSRMTQTQVAQPANFVLQVALAALWRSWGVEPAAIIGHSVGEVAAAHVAGILDLEKAIRVVYHRSRLQQQAAGLGTMLAAGISQAQAAPLLQQHRNVCLAAVNGPESVTLAGDPGELQQIATMLNGQGTFNRLLQVEVAYHSAYMDPLVPALFESLGDLNPSSPTVPFYSTVTGARAVSGVGDAAYWGQNMREPVYFARAMDSLIHEGHRVFLEVGPHPVLSNSIKECLAQHATDGVVLASLRREQSERHTLYMALAQLYTAGGMVDWSRFYLSGGKYVRLPTYPWQRETYWRETEEARFDRLGSMEHPLLGWRSAGPVPYWTNRLNKNLLPYLEDHRVDGLVILPGAAYVEIGLAVHRVASGHMQAALEDLEFHKALILEPHQEPNLFVTYEESTQNFSIYSQAEGANWALHARGRLASIKEADTETISLAELQTRLTLPIDPGDHYADMRRRGLEYGPYFQAIRGLWHDDEHNDVLAHIEGHASLALQEYQHHLHPTLLDAGFQTLLATLHLEDDDNLYVPVRIQRVRFLHAPSNNFWCYGRRTKKIDDAIEGDLTVFDETGAIVAQLTGIRAQALTRRDHDALIESGNWLYEFAWQRAATVDAPINAGRWLVFEDNTGVAEELIPKLETHGDQTVIRVRSGTTFHRDSAARYSMRPNDKDDIERLLQETAPLGLEGIVYCCGIDADATDPNVAPSPYTIAAINLIQNLVKGRDASPRRFIVVTRLAQPVRPQESELSVAQASLVGLVRVAINEYGERRFRAIDIDDSADAATTLAQEIVANSDEEEVAWRDGERYVPRLVRKRRQDLDTTTVAPADVPLFRADATYLITGGFGGFGLKISRWLIRHGARHLALVGRRGAGTPEAVNAVNALRRAGANVWTAAVDVADETHVQQLIAQLTADMPPLRGIFHTAAVLDDGPISQLDRQHVKDVMQPKAAGAWHLHCCTLDLPLDYFVLFSSIASLLGSPGQASYVMANTFLDTLAHYRRARNLPAISINWGALNQVGMASRHKGVQQYFQRAGVGSFTPPRALKILEKILRWNRAQLGACTIDWRLWGELYPTWATSPRYRHLLADQERDNALSQNRTLFGHLTELAPAERDEAVLAIVMDLASQTMKLAPERINRSHSLLSLGLDSLLSMELQMAIEKKIGVKVSIIELMKGSSLQQLARHLVSRIPLTGTKTSALPPVPSTAMKATPQSDQFGTENTQAIFTQTKIDRLTDEEVYRLLEKLRTEA